MIFKKPALKPRSDHSTDHQQQATIAKLLVEKSAVPLIAPLFVAALMVWVFRHDVPQADLTLWAGALVISYGLRFALFYKSTSYHFIWSLPFLPLFGGLVFLSGAIWGSAGFVFFTPDQIHQHALLAFCLGGLVAGAVVSYASWPAAFFAFAIPALLPLSARLIAQNEELQIAMGVMLLLFGVSLAVLARRTNRSLLQSMALQSALGNSEGRFQGVFETSPAGMLLLELDGQILLANRAFGQLLGYPPDALKGLNWRDISHPEEIQAVEQMDQRIVSGELPDLLVQKRYLHRDGHEIWADVATCLVRDQKNGNVCLLGQVFDITALKSVERMKNEFVSTVSHELRTPLTSIEGALGLVLGGATGDLSKDTQEMVTLARNNSRRLISLVNDLLDLDQLETNDLAYSFQLLDLNDLARDTIEQNRVLAESAGVTIAFTPFEHNSRVVGDRNRLAQVLTNLMSNAIKFSPNDGTVHITVTRHKAALRVSVTDEGCGVPDSFRETIFERFTQADASDTRAKGGAGLGLNISKSIIEKHGGALGFQSSPAKGAHFYYDLCEWTGAETLGAVIEKIKAGELRLGH